MTCKIPAKYYKEISECAKKYNRPLYEFLFRFTRGDDALAQDLVQEVLIEAAVKWSQLRVLDTDERGKRLRIMATRRAIDTFRKNETEQRYLPEILAPFWQPDTDPCVRVVTAEAIECFVKVVDALPLQQALAATLKWRWGWKNCEIADALGNSPSAVSQLLTKAKATLIRELRPYLPFESREPDGGA